MLLLLAILYPSTWSKVSRPKSLIDDLHHWNDLLFFEALPNDLYSDRQSSHLHRVVSCIFATIHSILENARATTVFCVIDPLICKRVQSFFYSSDGYYADWAIYKIIQNRTRGERRKSRRCTRNISASRSVRSLCTYPCGTAGVAKTGATIPSKPNFSQT